MRAPSKCHVSYTRPCCADYSKSSVRKATRFGNWNAAKRMLKTGARANVLTHVATMLVEQAYTAIRLVIVPMSTNRNHEIEPAKVAKLSVLIIVRGVTALTLGIVGGAIGTSIYPGKGTMIGCILGELAQCAIV